MTDLEEALLKVAAALDDAHVPYAVIGGVAFGLWGEPRYTADVDFVVGLNATNSPDAIKALGARFPLITPEARERLASGAHIQLAAAKGVTADLIPAAFPLYADVLNRAQRHEIHGVAVSFCSPEDLILLKVVSERPKDREDVRVVLERRVKTLDCGYIERSLEALAQEYDESAPLQEWLELKQAALNQAAQG